MNKQLETILEDLEYNKVFVKTVDGYDNKYLNEFEYWTFTKVYSFEKKDYIDIITFKSNFAWNEQIWKSIYEIRKKCIQKYGYDIVPLDFDMYAKFNFYDYLPVCNIKQKYIDKIRHNFNKVSINCKYLIGNQEGIMPLISNETCIRIKPIKDITVKFKRHQKNNIYYLEKYFDKNHLLFECWTYYKITKNINL